MPRVNIYLSDIDYEHWQIIENKSQFVADAINRSVITVSEENPKKVHMEVPKANVPAPVSYVKGEETVVTGHTAGSIKQHIENMEFEHKVAKMKQAPLVFCKHGAHPDFCKKKPSGGPCK